MLATLAGFFTVSPLDCLRQRDTKESRKTIANRIHVMDVNFSAEAPHCLLSSSFTAAPLGGSELGRLWQRTKQFYCDKGGFLAPRLLGALISGPITRLPPLGGKAPQIGSVCRPAGRRVGPRGNGNWAPLGRIQMPHATSSAAHDFGLNRAGIMSSPRRSVHSSTRRFGRATTNRRRMLAERSLFASSRVTSSETSSTLVVSASEIDFPPLTNSVSIGG